MTRSPILALALLAACAPQTPMGARPPEEPPAEPAPPEKKPPYKQASTEDVGTVVSSSNSFAADIYAQLKSRDGNFAASPASIALALSMTYAGARGETAEQLKSALKLSLDDERVHHAYGTLLHEWNAPGKRPYKLSVANRLFGEQTLPFDKAFLSTTANHYAAALEAEDFLHHAESARQGINGWIESKTNKRIQNLLPEGAINSDTKLVLANAIYFKGKWKTEFDKSATKAGDFHAPGGTHQTQMMHLRSTFKHAQLDGLQLVELPYQGDELSMTVMLPDAPDGMDELEKKLTADSLERWRSNMGTRDVILSLPRFKIDPPNPIELADVLEKLGVRDAFDPDKADFGRMSPLADQYSLHITRAVHKAFVEVNEEGTEAAAATAVVVGAETTAVHDDPPPVIFNADHPFLFVIRDKRGTILFIGRITQPA